MFEVIDIKFVHLMELINQALKLMVKSTKIIRNESKLNKTSQNQCRKTKID